MKQEFIDLVHYGGLLIQGAFHLVKISGISGSAVNGTRFVGSSHWKIPRKSGKSKKVVPFSRLEFPNGMSCSIYVSRSLYQFQVYGRAPRRTPDVPGFKTKWNNFLKMGNSTFAPTEISGFFFLNEKRPYSLICIILSDLLSRRKTQKNSYFQTRSERLIIIHIEEYLKLKAGVIGQQNVTKLFAQYFDLTKLVFISGQ